MLLSQTFRPAEDDQAPVLGLLFFLWALAAVVALVVIGVAFGPTGASDLHQLNDLLPADPRLWSAFTA